MVYEDIPPKMEGDPSVTLLEKPVISDRVIVVGEDAEIKSFTNTQIVFKSFKGLRAVRDENRGGRIEGYDIKELKEGAILVAYRVAGAADGFLIKVEKVVVNGTDIVVEYVEAQLNELFKDVHFTFTVPVRLPIPLNNSFLIENAIDDKGQKVTFRVGLEGLYEKAFKNDFELHIVNSEVILFSFLSTETTTTKLKFKESAGAGVSRNKTFEKHIDLPFAKEVKYSFLIQAGPVPIPTHIRFEPKLSLRSNVKSYVIDYQIIDKRVESISGSIYRYGAWEKVDEIISNIDNPPSLNSIAVEGEIKVSLLGSLNLSFYDQNNDREPGDKFTGATLELGIFGKVTGFCDTQKGLGVRGTTGADGRFYSHFKFLPAVLDWEVPFTLTETERLNLVIPNICDDEDETPSPIDNSIDRTVTAVSTSDPHLTTFDRAPYSFMAAGEFIAAKSTTDNFEVQVRQQEIPAKSNDGTVSWNTGIAIRTGNGDVCIYPPNQVFVNRQNIGTNFTSFNLSGTGKIEKLGQSLNITNSAGDVIRLSLFDTNLDYYITPATSRKGRLKGLLGNYDGQPTNDLQLQTGESVQNNYTSLYPKFSDSWRIRQTESLFVYDTGKNTESYTDRTFPRKPLSFTAAQRAAARSVCEAAGITDPVLLENCIIDVASTNNRDNTLPSRHYDSQVTAQVLNSFAIGGFSTSNVQLDYFEASASNNKAVLDTRQRDFSRIMMKNGVNIRRGFVTEFEFSTSELHSSSCFYLAIWPTEESRRNTAFQKRAAFCFESSSSGKSKTFFKIDNGPLDRIEKEVPNFVDGKTHRVKIVETLLTNNKWRVQLYLDDMNISKISVDNEISLSEQIQASNDVGYIEFQINRGRPSIVELYNWKFGAL